MRCPNCKEKYKINKIDNKTYKYAGVHDTYTCSYSFSTLQKSKRAVYISINEYILKTFPEIDKYDYYYLTRIKKA